MDDQFLRDLKQQPSPEFAARLRAALRTVPPHAAARVAPAVRGRKWFAAAASIAVVGFAFTLPPVRAAAEAFLDLFRVRNFTGVQFDPARLDTLEQSGFNPESLFGQIEPLTPEPQPTSYATAADAGAAAGIHVRVPTWLPQGFTATGIMGSSEMAARITLNTAGLQALLDTLGLADVELPQGLDGQAATVRIPPIVTQTFVNRDTVVTTQSGATNERSVHVIQARSPDVSFPAGIDLSKLAYAGLRVLGMSRDEAYRMSVTIDWRSTLIVPVPSQAVAYRPINVSGNEGLLIEGLAANESYPGGVLMWSAGEQTYAVAGAVSGEVLLEIAQNLQ
jgi:hypothetical protein